MSKKLPQCPFGRGNHQLVAAELSISERTWVANAYLIGGTQVVQLAKRFGLSKAAIYKWVNIVRNGGNFHAKGGRPPRIDPKHHQHLVQFLQGKPLNERMDTWELEVAKAVSLTAGDAGIAPCQVIPISRRTLMRTKKLLDVREGEAEVSTAARDEALADPRNALSFATVNACCVPISTPELIINVDATQFTCGDIKARGVPKQNSD
jgi:hypothetical protein